MVRKEIDSPASIKEKLFSLIISALLFSVIYNFSGWYASNSKHVHSFVLNFEDRIPFLSWMVIPYMSSGLFFCLIFFFCSSYKELSLLTKRINFITLVSGIIFILFPLKHTFVKPEVDSPLLGFFFQFLGTWDTNYNQAPSLHISYALIFWSVFRNWKNKTQRALIIIWLSLMGISTITIYQHHLIDIAASFVLVSITFFIFPDTKKRNLQVGTVYSIASAICLLFALLVYPYSVLSCFLLLWLVLLLFLIGKAYLQSNARFLKYKDGRIPLFKKAVFFPYIWTYKIMRHFFCKNTAHSVVEIFPSLFVGPILTNKQLSNLGFDRQQTVIVDLSVEVEESSEIRNRYTYYSCPILDIGGIEQKELFTILDKLSTIYDKLHIDEKIYMHCLMGYSRCVLVAAAFIRCKLNVSTEEAINQVKDKYPNAIFPQYLLVSDT